MDNRFRKLWAAFGSAFPTAFSPYWRALPLRRMRKFLVGTFFTGSAIGFTADLLQLDYRRLGRGFFWPILGGVFVASLALAAIKRMRLILPLYLVVALLAGLGYSAIAGSASSLVPDAVRRRVVFDAVGIFLCAGLGYRLLVSFATTEGLAGIRMQTELALAHGIQATLVPPLSFQTSAFEVYGKSIPSTEMGGDLIDVVESHGNLLAYVADISGHGLAAGQLMGMLKTAMRVSLQFGQPPVAWLERADRVLPAVKAPEMFATLALLYFDGSAQAEYASAGHIPVLHCREGGRETVRLYMEQFPLGLLPGGCYASQRVAYAPGDLFLLLTDGITEVPDASGEEFGLARLEQLLAEHAAQPLPLVWELIMEEVRRHGSQQDDQTLLLVRVRS
jgi:hypothetical protein